MLRGVLEDRAEHVTGGHFHSDVRASRGLLFLRGEENAIAIRTGFVMDGTDVDCACILLRWHQQHSFDSNRPTGKKKKQEKTGDKKNVKNSRQEKIKRESSLVQRVSRQAFRGPKRRSSEKTRVGLSPDDRADPPKKEKKNSKK